VETVLQALSAPRRREILGLLRRRERSAGEIHRALGGVTFGAVSQHLGQLEQAGLVSARREGRRRFYAARPEALAPVRAWLDELWQAGLLRLQQLAEAEERSARPARARRAQQDAGRGAGHAATRGPARGRAAGRRPITRRQRRRTR
jgi:DNA-binding transcriptional ArsR family regulator